MKLAFSNKGKHAPKTVATVAAGVVPLPADLASDRPQVMFCSIGPTQAQRLLDINTANRRKVQKTIDRYARDVAHQRFDLSNDAISVYTSGKLATGQHRCEAVIKAGKSIVSLVMLGLPEAAASKLDQPVTRKQSQNLHIRGQLEGMDVDTTSTDIATARCLVGADTMVLTMEELQEVLARYAESLAFAKHHAGTSNAPARAGIAAAYMHGVDQEVLARFCAVLADGVTNGTHEGVVVRLREKLPTLPATTTGRIQQRRVTMNAIKFFVAGHAPTRLPIPDHDLYPLGTFNEENT